MKRILSVILCASLILCALPLMASADVSREPITADKKLKVSGTKLVDQAGNEVVLKGTNLGGWLVYESWMGSGDCADNTELNEILEERFGKENAETLIKTYQENYITESDLDNIADMGFNCVRIPFWYRNFQDENGVWILDENGNIDFSVLEWLVSECCERGIYVVLDLHGAPGAQSVAHHTGITNSCKLYDESSVGEQYREETAIFWQELANRFKDYPNVASYDLLNEPTCDMDTSAYLAKLWALYDKLYDAVRDVDKNTVIAFEGVWTLDMLPVPELYDWQNVMYEVHLYNYTDDSVDDAINSMLSYRDYYNVPVYVGECNFGDSYKYALDRLCDEKVSYTTWCYKGITDDTGSTWFIYAGNGADVDLRNDSYAEILVRWKFGTRTSSMTENAELRALLTNAAAKQPSFDNSESVSNWLSIIYRVYFTIISVYKAIKSAAN